MKEIAFFIRSSALSRHPEAVWKILVPTPSGEAVVVLSHDVLPSQQYNLYININISIQLYIYIMLYRYIYTYVYHIFE